MLPATGGLGILRRGALQEREGGQAAEPGVASRSPTLVPLGIKANISFDIPFFKEASVWVDKGDVGNLKKVFREVVEVSRRCLCSSFCHYMFGLVFSVLSVNYLSFLSYVKILRGKPLNS